MLSVLLNWIYITVTVGCLGLGFAKFSQRILHYRIKSVDSILVTGLVIATVYAQAFSLLYKVGMLANIILLFICAVILLIIRKDFVSDVRQYMSEYKGVKGIVVLLLLLLWAYFTSRGYIHHDSDLYHAQSIRWIEEYGAVPGLGNLHLRLAYNSSVFALSALYSMKFLVGESLHTISGFFAFILSLEALNIVKGIRNKHLRLSDYARVAAIYYLTLICEEVVSPASDYLIMCTIFFIIIKWLRIIEEETEEQTSIVPYSLLCVCGVFAVSLKLTAGLILLLVIKPAYLLIKYKKWKEITLFITLGILVIAPWMIRTVVLSGYLLYPFPGLDIFNYDWKISLERATWDSKEIKVWGRGLNDVSKIDWSISQWLPNWFTTMLTGTEKLLVLADFASIAFLGVMAIVGVFRKAWKELDYAIVMLTTGCSYLFWQFSAPLMRYGYAYVLLMVALTGGFILQKLAPKVKWLETMVCVGIILIGIWKIFPTTSYIVNVSGENYYFTQKSYGTYETLTYEINGLEFYYPVESGRVGYDAFPSSPDGQMVEFRGDTIADGFRNYE